MWLGIGFISIGLNNRPTLKSISDVLKVTFPVLFLVYLINVIINFFAEGEPANYWFMMHHKPVICWFPFSKEIDDNVN